METCPNCNTETEENFEVCWNCNYSFTERKVIDISEPTQKGRVIDCLRCKVPMAFSGNYKFHEGSRIGFFGNLFEAFVNREEFELYVCPQCSKVEFYLAQ